MKTFSVACMMLACVLGTVYAETVACREPTGWEGAEETDDCWTNAPFSDGVIENCDQLGPDESTACVDLCHNCFNYCNAQCDFPTTVFENNSDPLVAGCSCVQATVPPISSAHAAGVGTAAVAATAFAAHVGLQPCM